MGSLAGGLGTSALDRVFLANALSWQELTPRLLPNSPAGDAWGERSFGGTMPRWDASSVVTAEAGGALPGPWVSDREGDTFSVLDTAFADSQEIGALFDDAGKPWRRATAAARDW